MGKNGRRKEARAELDALRESLDVYLSARSGIRFELLTRFAGPLFDLYDVEWRLASGIDPSTRDRQELATIVAVLDAARLLWSFFSLDDEESLTALPDLEDALLGSSAGDEERSNLLVLLSLFEEHWHTFTPEDREHAERTPGYALPDFETLLKDFVGASRRLPSQTRQTFGPDRLDLPEALALFAEPLLSDAVVEGDPDAIEDRVARAQAYWDLAHVSDDQFDEELERIEQAFSNSARGRADIRREAETMVKRYRDLFPEESGM